MCALFRPRWCTVGTTNCVRLTTPSPSRANAATRSRSYATITASARMSISSLTYSRNSCNALPDMRDFFASCPKGLEYLLVDELKSLGASDVHEALAGVYFRGGLDAGYRACLWSRL